MVTVEMLRMWRIGLEVAIRFGRVDHVALDLLSAIERVHEEVARAEEDMYREEARQSAKP